MTAGRSESILILAAPTRGAARLEGMGIMARLAKADEERITAAVAAAASGTGWEVPDPSEIIVAKPSDALLKLAGQLGEFSDAASKPNEGWLARLFDNKDEVERFSRVLRPALNYLNRSLKVAGPVQRTDGKWLVQYKAGKVKEEQPAESQPAVSAVPSPPQQS